MAGYEMVEVGKPAASAPIPYLFILGFLVFVALVKIGYRRRK